MSNSIAKSVNIKFKNMPREKRKCDSENSEDFYKEMFLVPNKWEKTVLEKTKCKVLCLLERER